jgi:hypothetical protein
MPDIAKLTHEAELGHGSALKADFMGHSLEDNLKLMQQIMNENKKHVIDDPNTPELSFQVESSSSGVTGRFYNTGLHWWNRSTELVNDHLTINGADDRPVASQDIEFKDAPTKK